MNKLIFTVRSIGLILLGVLLLFLSNCCLLPEEQTAQTVKKRSFEITYITSITDLPAEGKDLRVWIPCPQTSQYQTISHISIESPYPYEIRSEPEYGNKMVYLHVENPLKGFNVTLKFRATRIERKTNPYNADNETKESLSGFLCSTPLVPTSGLAEDIANKILSDKQKEIEKARALYNYVLETMTYDKTGTGWGRGDFHYACHAKRGNCTDFHAMFNGLARTVSLPAKFEIGLSIPKKKLTGETGGYHCWALCYLQKHGWIPVDISEADKHPELAEYFFGTHCENRVMFSTGRNIILSPPQQGKPLNFFIFPYAELDGNIFKGISKRSFFKDI